MVPGSRNPMWGEEFNFSVDDLPVEVFVSGSNLDYRSKAFIKNCSALTVTTVTYANSCPLGFCQPFDVLRILKALLNST